MIRQLFVVVFMVAHVSECVSECDFLKTRAFHFMAQSGAETSLDFFSLVATRSIGRCRAQSTAKYATGGRE